MTDTPSGLDHVVAIVQRSELDEVVRVRAVQALRSHAEELDNLFTGLHFKAPTALPEFAEEFARYSLSVMQPVLLEYKIPIPTGRKVYSSIYESICGKN
ncbi:MAG: hypothetical protein AABX72_01120 [Nanoarchaeota archaeon]